MGSTLAALGLALGLGLAQAATSYAALRKAMQNFRSELIALQAKVEQAYGGGGGAGKVNTPPTGLQGTRSPDHLKKQGSLPEGFAALKKVEGLGVRPTNSPVIEGGISRSLVMEQGMARLRGALGEIEGESRKDGCATGQHLNFTGGPGPDRAAAGGAKAREAPQACAGFLQQLAGVQAALNKLDAAAKASTPDLKKAGTMSMEEFRRQCGELNTAFTGAERAFDVFAAAAAQNVRESATGR